MCGRYTQRHNAAELADRFEVEIVEELAPRYNIAPTQAAPIIYQRAPNAPRQFGQFLWGLVPAWDKTRAQSSKLINAKAETLTQKPSFKYSYERRRCLIPVDGFYEWDQRVKPNHPYYFSRLDGGLFAFAGLWDECKLLSGETLHTFTIITVAPNEFMEPYHHRMAAILRVEDEAAWLNPATRLTDLPMFLQPFAEGQLQAHPVATTVNDARVEGANLIVPVSIPPIKQTNLFESVLFE